MDLISVFNLNLLITQWWSTKKMCMLWLGFRNFGILTCRYFNRQDFKPVLLGQYVQLNIAIINILCFRHPHIVLMLNECGIGVFFYPYFQNELPLYWRKKNLNLKRPLVDQEQFQNNNSLKILKQYRDTTRKVVRSKQDLGKIII